MKKIKKVYCFVFIVIYLLVIGKAAFGGQKVGLYDVWETRVTNPNKYSNPFNFNVIELKATFTSPSGRQVDFFGFYDGDGEGRQKGNIWKLRFMPDETGVWTFFYNWTDKTPGGFGSFNVVDTGISGPLKIATDNSWFFMDARGKVFHWRGYDLHILARSALTKSFVSQAWWVKRIVKKYVIEKNYNFTVLDGLINREGIPDPNNWNESWWESKYQKNKFNLSVWHAWEDILNLAKKNQVYVATFSGMIYQGHNYSSNDFEIFLRYWVARFGPYYNFLGWSPTWEWMDIWSPGEVNQIMKYVLDINPFPTMLSAHDCSHSSFATWLSFSMRQSQSRNIFDGNSRVSGQNQGSCDGIGGVGEPFLDMPIIGSEDVWETSSGKNGHPRNPTEVRRAAWGIMMAGVMPLYSEWHPNPPPKGGRGGGEPEMRRMFNFIYSKTRYREYKQLNALVSKADRQIASGIFGEEYLIYDEDSGLIVLDLTGTSESVKFSVLWFDPTSGKEIKGESLNGGETINLISPFSEDSVLLISKFNEKSIL